MPQVSLSELLDAYLWGQGGSILACRAVVSRRTGEVFCYSDDLPPDEVGLPEDFEDSDDYLAVPDQYELDLGRDLVWNFVHSALPEQVGRVREVFHGSGKYGRFKRLLDSLGRLQEWFDYEAAEQHRVLREWAEADGFEVVEGQAAADAT